MSVLSDKTIAKRIETGELVIEDCADIKGQLQAASLDLRLGNVLRRRSEGERKYDEIHAGPGETFDLEPNTLYRGYTRETIKLPRDIMAFLTGRNQITESGINVGFSIGPYQPGFEGVPRFHLYNARDKVISIESGYPVVQMVFFGMDQPVETAYGEQETSRYQNQSGIGE